MNTGDALNLASYILGMANLKENLSQSDKDDILRTLDHNGNILLTEIRNELHSQNTMLKEIMNQNEEILGRLNREG